MNLDPFSLLIAVVPVAVYVGWIAAVRLSGRYLVTTSSRDAAALGLALFGFVAIGPAQLFFPNSAATVFGPRVWLAIAVLYALCLTLVTLSLRPALVVFGRTPSEVYGPLLAACRVLDESCEGDEQTLSVHLPTVGVRLRCDGMPDRDVTRVQSFAPSYGPPFWNRLATELKTAGVPMGGRRPGGVWALAGSVIALLAAIGWGASQPEVFFAEMQRWWRR